MFSSTFRRAALLIAAGGVIPFLLIFNLFEWRIPWAGGALLLILIASCGALIGRAWYAEDDWYDQLIAGMLFTAAFTVIGGTALFYIFGFTDFAASLLLLSLPWIAASIDLRSEDSIIDTLLYEGIKQRKRFALPHTKQLLTNSLAWIIEHLAPIGLGISYLTLIALAFSFATSRSTDTAIRTPWEVVPLSLLIVYGLASFALLLLHHPVITKDDHPPLLTRLLTSTHILFTVSLAALVYRLGYGFDPFIHRATETLISETGIVTPLPFMYVGQYTLTLFIAKFTALPLAMVDRWLLPSLASILIPTLLAVVARVWRGDARSSLPLPLLILVFPLSFFIFTVPQQLGNLFFASAIAFSFSFLTGGIPFGALWLLGGAALAIHPLSGLPALIMLAILTPLSSSRTNNRITLAGLIALGGGALIPALVAFAQRQFIPSGSQPPVTIPLPTLFEGYLPFLSFAHLAEFWHRLHPLLLITCMAWGSARLMKEKRAGLFIPLALTALSLLISYTLLRTQALHAIISYERGEFVHRVLELTLLTLFPLVAIALHEWGVRIARARAVAVSACVALFITFGFYYTYPHVDAFAKSRGYSVSADDIDAARWIEDDARGMPYIVLANQSVAAAALQEFGFKQYFATSQGTLFYYPIPTSSPLYQYYLDMVYKEASRATVADAAALAGVTRAYFVLNDYWLDAQKIAPRAELEADAITRRGTVTVFMYDLTKSSTNEESIEEIPKQE